MIGPSNYLNYLTERRTKSDLNQPLEREFEHVNNEQQTKPLTLLLFL